MPLAGGPEPGAGFGGAGHAAFPSAVHHALKSRAAVQVLLYAHFHFSCRGVVPGDQQFAQLVIAGGGLPRLDLQDGRDLDVGRQGALLP
jgi:hypothetical protein